MNSKRRIIIISIFSISVLIVSFNLLLTGCIYPSNPIENIPAKVDIYTYEVCNIDSLLLPDVKIDIYDIEEGVSTCGYHSKKPIYSGVTGLEGKLHFDMNIPPNGKTIDLCATLSLKDSAGNIIDTPKVGFTYTICSDSRVFVIFDCIEKGCVLIKRSEEPDSLYKLCGGSPLQDTIKGITVPPKVFATYENFRDNANKEYTIYNPNPFAIIGSLKLNNALIKDQKYASLRFKPYLVSQAKDSIFILPPKSVRKFNVEFNPPTLDEFEKDLLTRTQGKSPAPKDSCYIGCITFSSGNCECVIYDTSFVTSIPNSCTEEFLPAYGQKTDLLSMPSWEVYSLVSKKINIAKYTPDPANTNLSTLASFYVTANDNIGGTHHDPIFHISDPKIQMYGPIRKYTPDEFCGNIIGVVYDGKDFLNTPKNALPNTIQLSSANTGEVYIFKYGSIFGLIQITTVWSGDETDNFTKQSYVFFNLIYPFK